MRKLTYYVGASTDGYIAGPGGEIDFFPLSDELLAWIVGHYPESIPTHIRRHLGIDDSANQAFDTLVMGRGTFEPALTIPTTSPYSHMRQYVVSGTLEVDDPSVAIEPGDPIDLVRRLKSENSELDVWLCGGGALAGSLLPEIDEIVLKQYPVIAGSGIPLFAGGFTPTRFAPTQQHEFPDGARVVWMSRDG